MKVRKVGHLNERNEMVLAGKTRGLFVRVLCLNSFNQDIPTSTVILSLIIGEGTAAREHKFEIPVATEVLEVQHATPTSLASGGTFILEGERFFGAFIFR